MHVRGWKPISILGFLPLLLLVPQLPAAAQTFSNGYAYRNTITISHTQVPNTDQASFPVLISGAYSFLATTANGGYVTNSNGYDIIFTSDAAGTSVLPFEQESYSAVTGQVAYWVQIPTVSHTADTVFYVFYGNSSITTDQSNRTGTWESNYKSVWHLATKLVFDTTDSTSNGNNGTAQGGVSATSGVDDGAASFDGISGYISTTTNLSLSNLTSEAWVNTTSTAGHKVSGVESNQTGTGSGGYAPHIYVDTNGKAVAGCYSSGSHTIVSSAAVNDGNWHHLVMTVNTSTNVFALYVDGASQGTGSCAPGTMTGYFRMGSYKLSGWANGSDGYFAGIIDEVRLSSSVRSSDWITTEYNNQSSPSTFYSLSVAQTGFLTPNITSLSPTSGAVGASVTVTGTSFGSSQGSSTVTFNGMAATVTSWSGTSIAATVPLGAATGNVIATVGGLASNGVSFTVSSASSWSNGYSYRRPITIDHTKVPNTDQANFPVLISGTYADLATTANGGYVTNSSGYDIVFASDPAGTNVLAFEQETYNASTGAVNYWVKVPAVSHTTDTIFYMFYGNSAVTTDQSNKNAVWDSNYKSVWHLPNGTTLSATDSTSNADNGTNSGMTASAGEIDGAASGDGGNGHQINTANNPYSSSVFSSNGLTLSAWVKPASTPSGNPSQIVSLEGAYVIDVTTGGKLGFEINGTGTDIASSASVPNSSWTYIVGTSDSSGHLKTYVNGVADTTGSQTFYNLNSLTRPFTLAGHPTATGFNFNGTLDEARISNIARSADWIAAEYNNQSSPSTFYSLGVIESGIPTPQITSLSPTSGAVGASVTITGTNFESSQGSSTVTFNGIAATVTSWSGTSIATTVPLGAASGNVIVTVGGLASNGVSFTVSSASSWSNGYGYRRPITIDHTKVSNSNQSNFPVLISGTYADLATTANGGYVTNSSGYDIVFASDGAGANVLPYERESYNSSTGAVNFWVQVPTVSHTSDTTIYVFYGDSSITTDQSNKTGTWDSNYKGVWHFDQTPSGSGSELDSTSNGYNGTPASSGISLSSDGISGGSLHFNGTSAGNNVSMSSSLPGGPPITVSIWIKTTGLNSSAQSIIIDKSVWSSHGWSSLDDGQYNSVLWFRTMPDPGDAPTIARSMVNNGTWHYLVGTINSSNVISYYLDGSLNATSTPSSFSADTSDPVSVGAFQGNSAGGSLTEVRISNAVRSADWIATEYNNQSSPSTFYSLSFAQTGVPTPTITSLSPTSGAIGASVTVTGTNFGSSQGSSTVTFNGTTATVTSWSSTSIAAIVPALATTGNVAVTVDAAPSSGSSFTVLPTPTITTLSRRSGAAGAVVTITGSGFGATQGSGTVSFNGTTASSITSWSATSITTAVPSGATTGSVVVFASGANSNGASFSVLALANITSLSKTSGFAGNPITITGTNFGSAQTAVAGSVSFNGTAASVTSWSSTSIVAVVPVGATTGNVVVTANGGPSNGVSFTIGLPVVTSLSPTSGAVGASVTIAGSNFGATQGGSTVTFNGTSATAGSWSATSIGVTVPTGASTGQVVVTVSGVPSQGAVFGVTATLSGTVTQSGGSGITGASVQVLQNGSTKASTTTASGGTYSISGLQTGSYDVTFSASGFGTALQTAVSVSGSGTTLNQTLGAAGTIAGQITQSNGTTAISGASIAVTQSGEPISTATSNGSGNYSIGNLSAGSYSVSASATGYVALGLNGVSVTTGNTTTENLSLQAVGSCRSLTFYDSLSRLVGVVDTAGEAAGYSYDAVGNLLAITRGTSAQTSVISFTPSQGTGRHGRHDLRDRVQYDHEFGFCQLQRHGSHRNGGYDHVYLRNGPLRSNHWNHQRDQSQWNRNQCDKLCCHVECGNADHRQLFADDWNPRNVADRDRDQLQRDRCQRQAPFQLRERSNGHYQCQLHVVDFDGTLGSYVGTPFCGYRSWEHDE